MAPSGQAVDAGVAARAQVEVDRVAALPLGCEGAEPAAQPRQTPAVHAPMRAPARSAAAAAIDQHVDVELVGRASRPRARRASAAPMIEAAPARAVADVGHRLRRRQLAPRRSARRSSAWRSAASRDQPPVSRMLTKRIGRSLDAAPRLRSARSVRGRGGAPACRRPAARRRCAGGSWRRAGTRRPRAGTAACARCSSPSEAAPRRLLPAPVASAGASSGIVWLQSQISVFIGGSPAGSLRRQRRSPGAVVGRVLRRLRRRTSAEKLRLRHLAQHADAGNGSGLP